MLLPSNFNQFFLFPKILPLELISIAFNPIRKEDTHTAHHSPKEKPAQNKSGVKRNMMKRTHSDNTFEKIDRDVIKEKRKAQNRSRSEE